MYPIISHYIARSTLMWILPKFYNMYILSYLYIKRKFYVR